MMCSHANSLILSFSLCEHAQAPDDVADLFREKVDVPVARKEDDTHEFILANREKMVGYFERHDLDAVSCITPT